MTPPWYGTIMIQMLKALKFLHSENINIIHRDIKPENILFNDLGHCVLADFGHARRRLPAPRGHSDSYEFMCPEMYEGQEQTPLVDIWSLGMVGIDMIGCMPKAARSRTINSMKEMNWYRAMWQLAGVVDKSELRAMVNIDPLCRPTASALLTYLENSTVALRQKPTAGLVYLMLRSKFGPSMPEEQIRGLVAEYLAASNPTPVDQFPSPPSSLSEEDLNPTTSTGLTQEDQQQAPTRRTSVIRRTIARAPIQSSTPIRLLPGSQGMAGRARTVGVSSIPPTRPLIGARRAMGSLRPAVMLPTTDSRTMAGPSSSAAASSASTSPGMAGPSSATATPSSTGPKGRGDRTRAAAMPPLPARSQEPSRAAATTQTTGSRKEKEPKITAAMPPPPARYQGPTRPAATPPRTQSQEVGDASRAAATSSHTVSERTGSPPRAAPSPLRTAGNPPRGARRPPRAGATQQPDRSQGVERPSKAASTQTPTKRSMAAATQTPEKQSKTIGTQSRNPSQGVESLASAAAMQMPGRPQEIGKPSRTIAMQTQNPSQGTVRMASAAAPSQPAVAQESAGPSSSTSGDNVDSAGSKGDRQASPEKGEAKALKPGNSTQQQPRTRPLVPKTGEGSKRTDSPPSTSSSIREAKSPGQSRTGSGHGTSSRPLSIDAPEFHPPGHQQRDRGRPTGAEDRQPISQREDRWYQENVEARRHVRPPTGRGQQGGFQSRRPAPISSNLATQGYSIWDQPGLPGPPPLNPLGESYPVWAHTGMYSPTTGLYSPLPLFLSGSQNCPVYLQTTPPTPPGFTFPPAPIYPLQAQGERSSQYAHAQSIQPSQYPYGHGQQRAAQSYPVQAQSRQPTRPVESPGRQRGHQARQAPLQHPNAHGERQEAQASQPSLPRPAAQGAQQELQATQPSPPRSAAQDAQEGSQARQSPPRSATQDPPQGSQARQSPRRSATQGPEQGPQASKSPPRRPEAQGRQQELAGRPSPPPDGAEAKSDGKDDDGGDWELPRHVRRRESKKKH